MIATIDDYARLSDAQKGKVRRDELKEIVDAHLRNKNTANVVTNEVREIITDTIKTAVEQIIVVKTQEIITDITDILKKDREELEKENEGLRADVNSVKEENKVIKKIILEQQKFLEAVKREKIRNNVFITGIPNEVNLNDEDTANMTSDNNRIINNIVSFLLPDISSDDYKINIAFEPKTGFERHSAIISFTDNSKKAELLTKTKELKTRTDPQSWLRKVYMRSEQPPLTSKENSRLFAEMKKLREQYEGDETANIKLEKGKLTFNGTVVDEFNLTNQIF